MAELDGLDVGEGELAEPEQRRGERVGDGGLLILRHGALAAPCRPLDQLAGELVQVGVAESSLLPFEGDERGQPHGLAGDADFGARAVLREQSPHQGGYDTGRDLQPGGARLHGPPSRVPSSLGRSRILRLGFRVQHVLHHLGQVLF